MVRVKRPAQRRTEAAQVGEHLPEERLGQGGIALLVGVGEAVLARRGGPAHGRERPRMEPQPVTDIMEADGVDELGDQMGRNELAELPQHGQLETAWRTWGLLSPPNRVAGTLRPPIFFLSAAGMAVSLTHFS
jgi:hypothetical protein